MRLSLVGLLLLVGCTAAPVVPSPPGRGGGLEVEPISGLGLFADERARSQALLASALTARDTAVVAPELTARAWTLAAEGKNPFTGAACGRELGEWQARARWSAALGLEGTVNGQVWCEDDGGCELVVRSHAPDAGFEWVAPFPREGEALAALASTLPRLAPPTPEPEGAGGLGLLGSMGGTQPIQEDDRLEVRVWPADQRHRSRPEEEQQRAAFPALTVDQVLACLPPNGDRVALLIEVSTSGQLRRCEVESSSGTACACGQLARGGGAAWLRGQRWQVSLSVDRRDQTSGDRRFVLSGYWNTMLVRTQAPGEEFPRFKPRVEDPSIEAWTPGSARLATGCFSDAFTAATRISSRWAVWFDGAGRPTKVLEQKGFPPLPKDLAACVARALKTAQSPCPSRPGLWAMGDLHVLAGDPHAPPAAVQDR